MLIIFCYKSHIPNFLSPSSLPPNSCTLIFITFNHYLYALSKPLKMFFWTVFLYFCTVLPIDDSFHMVLWCPYHVFLFPNCSQIVLYFSPKAILLGTGSLTNFFSLSGCYFLLSSLFLSYFLAVASACTISTFFQLISNFYMPSFQLFLKPASLSSVRSLLTLFSFHEYWGLSLFFTQMPDCILRDPLHCGCPTPLFQSVLT